MALTQVTFGTGTNDITAGTAITVAMTGATGANLAFVLGVAIRPDVNISSVSGGGLTWTARKDQCAARNQGRVEIWTAYGTPSGTSFDITVTLASSSTGTSGVCYVLSGAAGGDTSFESFQGANSLGMNGACTGGTDDALADIDVTPIVSGTCVLTFLNPRSGNVPAGSQDPDYTTITNVSGGTTSGNTARTYLFVRLNAPSGMETVAHTLNAATDWAMAAAVIKPSGGGGASTFTKTGIGKVPGVGAGSNAVEYAKTGRAQGGL